MSRIILLILTLVAFLELPAQTVNEPLVRKKVEEALRKHRQGQRGTQTESAEQQEQQQRIERRAEKTAAFVQSQRQLTENAASNIESAREWSVEEMKSRYSLSRDKEVKPVSATDIMKARNHQSAQTIRNNGLQVAPKGVFYTRSELDYRLRRHYFASTVQEDTNQPLTIFQKAWDFINMDYVEYLNSNRRSLGEDVARKFYKNAKEALDESSEYVSAKWDGFVEFLKSDWDMLYQQKVVDVREDVIEELPTKAPKFVGKVFPKTSKFMNKISVMSVIFIEEKNSISGVLSKKFAREAFEAVETGNTKEIDARFKGLAENFTGLASKVVEEETGTKIKKLEIDKESISSELADHVTVKANKKAKDGVKNLFYQKVKEHLPGATEQFETAKSTLE